MVYFEYVFELVQRVARWQDNVASRAWLPGCSTSFWVIKKALSPGGGWWWALNGFHRLSRWTAQDFCVDESLQQRSGTQFPFVVAGHCAYNKWTNTRRIFAFDFEVTIINNSHLSVNGVWAKRINDFRGKSFDFFVNYSSWLNQEYSKRSASLSMP